MEKHVRGHYLLCIMNFLVYYLQNETAKYSENTDELILL